MKSRVWWHQTLPFTLWCAASANRRTDSQSANLSRSNINQNWSEIFGRHSPTVVKFASRRLPKLPDRHLGLKNSLWVGLGYRLHDQLGRFDIWTINPSAAKSHPGTWMTLYSWGWMPRSGWLKKGPSLAIAKTGASRLRLRFLLGLWRSMNVVHAWSKLLC